MKSNYSKMKKVIVAIDSFKGSLTSIEANLAALEGLQSVLPEVEVCSYPVADGGEGLLDAFCANMPIQQEKFLVHDPLMRPIIAHYGRTMDKKTAFIELASASGLPLLSKGERDPLLTTTYGTGELIRQAIDIGCRNFIIGLGGSATNDAGLGLLQALGYQFLDKNKHELQYGGQILQQVVSVDDSHVLPPLKECRFTVACDVKNPLWGKDGAAFIFAPQKGACGEDVRLLDNGLRSIANIFLHYTGKNIALLPGAGAAGGTGAALSAFLDAELKPGIDLLLDEIHFDQKLKGADLIITGEGTADRQTLMGKVPFGILCRAKAQRIPVILIAGKIIDKEILKDAGFADVISINQPFSSLSDDLLLPETAKQNIRQTMAYIIRNAVWAGS